VTTWRLMDGVSGRPGAGSSGTTPPTSPTGYSGNFIAGLNFEVTQGGMWFEGYWWWCPPGGDTGAQKFALWAITGNGTATLIPAGTVTSGTLTAGAWNYVALSSPVQVAIGTAYVAATGWSAVHGFPDSGGQFGSGGPYASGITNGPLIAPSDGTGGGSAPTAAGTAQGVFSTAGTDPAVNFPSAGSSSSNFWVDVSVSDTAPSGYAGSYRIWPNKYDVAYTGTGIDSAANYILGTEFVLAQSCTLGKIWFYSPAGASQLPTQCCVWNVSSTAMVAGTLKTSPSWSGAAGSGWVSASYSGVTLPAGDYKAAVWNGAGSPSGFNEYSLYYFTTLAGAAGITSGPVTVPNASGATSPGQSTYQTNSGTFAYPNLYVSGQGQSYWVDVEVTPAGSPHTATAALTVTPSFTAARVRGKYRTGALTVTPVFSAARTRGKYRTAALIVTSSFSAARTRGKHRTAGLTVTPSFSAVTPAGSPHTATAALTITPSLAAVRTRGKHRPAVLIIAATFSAARTRGKYRTAALTVTPAFTAAVPSSTRKASSSPSVTLAAASKPSVTRGG
jgi:hypothetical protein